MKKKRKGDTFVDFDSSSVDSLSGSTMLAEKEQEYEGKAFFPGMKIGDYTVIKQIGFGGMGIIIKASAPDSSFVALKVIKSEHINSKAMVKRFLKEMKISSMLKHKNIASFLGGGVDEYGRNYFAMKFIDGVNLHDLLEKNAISLNLALNIFTQLCTGLEYAHSQNIIHRDIKPENIIINKDGVVKIIDFGIARVDKKDTSSLTLTNVIMGSPIYMSPEQKSDFKHVDLRTDIYAAGAVFYEMLSGAMPGGLLRIDIIPEHLRSIVEKSIAYEVDKRYSSAGDILQDLNAYRNNKNFEKDQQAIRKIEDNVKLRQVLIRSFYPESIPDVAGLDIADFYIPAEGIGGNYYDYIKIDEMHTAILVGNIFENVDVEAALFLAMLRSVFRVIATESTDPGITFKKLNNFLSTERFNTFALFSYMIFNSKTKEVSIASAGYRPIMILRKGGKEFIEIKCDDVALGMIENYDYETIRMNLKKGDMILLSSDGVGKTVNREGEFFGDSKLADFVIANTEEECGCVVEGIKNTILKYGAGTAQQDDITVVLAKVK